MSPQNEFRFAKSVQTLFLLLSIALIVLVVTIPLGIYFLIRRSAARLVFDAGGFRVRGMGLTSDWRYANLERIGTLSIHVVGGFGHAINGGPVAMNLCARTKDGKNLKFMLSRFDQHQAILQRIVSATGLPLETLTMGAMGPKWPARSADAAA